MVEPNSDAALLFTAAMRDMTNANDPLSDVAPFRRVSTVGWVAIGVVGAVALLFLFAIIACSGGACR